MPASLRVGTWSPVWVPAAVGTLYGAFSLGEAWLAMAPDSATRHPAFSWGGAVIGLAMTTLMVALTRRLILTQRAADALTDNLTHDLEHLALVAEETSDMVIITDPQRRIRWVNEAFTRNTGYSAMEALGRSPGELLQCPETDPATITQMRVTLDAGLTFRGEVRNRAKDGHLYWLDLLIQPLHDSQGKLDGFMSVQSDITARREMEAELQRRSAMLRAAIDTIDEAFVVFDPDDRLVYCNDKYREIFATSADLLVEGMPFEELMRTGVQRGQYREAVGREEAWVAERLARHRQPGQTLHLTTDTGRMLKVKEHRLPDGHLVGFRVDITDLMLARQAAERADKAKSEFIATISHELRTPLQSIIGFSELGQHFAQGQTQIQPLFDEVVDAGRRMLYLVNGLLDVTKIDGTQGSLVLREGDLSALVHAVVQELRPQLAERRLSIETPGLDRPWPALVEPFRMRQVLRNVLANAIRFSPPGAAIEIAPLRPDPAGLGLSIRDHGPGIPPDELETVFEPFVQSTRTRTGAGGTGLGLTISRRIAQAHGGQLHAELPADGGTRFVLRLPHPLPNNPPPHLPPHAPPVRPHTAPSETPCPSPS